MQRLSTAATIRAVLGDAKASDDIKELATRGMPQKAIDELLLQLAASGNTTTAQQLLSGSSLGGNVAEFLRGYFAYQRGDQEESARRLGNVAVASSDDPGVAEVVAKARFLMGEMVYDAFLAGGRGELADAIAEKGQLLAAADEAYAQAIGGRQARWALFATARVADAYTRYAAFLKGLKLPDDLSAEERTQLEQVITAKIAESNKRAQEIRTICSKRARDGKVFSEAGRACLQNEPLPERVPVLPPAVSRRAGDPAGAAELRAVLLKNPRSVESLVKLAELYLGAGDLGTTLLVLERAETVDPKRSDVHNLRGVAYERLAESDAAFREWKRAVELDGKNQQARVNLAAHYAAYGFLDEAAAELKKAGGSYSARGGVTEHPNMNALSRVGGGK